MNGQGLAGLRCLAATGIVLLAAVAAAQAPIAEIEGLVRARRG